MHNRPIVSQGLAELVTAARSVVDRRPDWPPDRAMVWRPGDVTAIHDHVTWCVFRITLDEQRASLVEAGTRQNAAGEVSGFAPPGEIQRVRNAGDDTAISPHLYGTDVSRIGSSVRRNYYRPVVPTTHEGFVTDESR